MSRLITDLVRNTQGTTNNDTVPTQGQAEELAQAVQDNLDTHTGAANPHSGSEPTIAAAGAGEYWRGDKTWQTLDKSAVGLGNVDNTSDADKPVSSATQTALNGKASLSGATFTGTVKFGDNVKIAFGASDDIEIYHDGTDNIVKCNNGKYKILGVTNINNAYDLPSAVGTNGQVLTYDGVSTNAVWKTPTPATLNQQKIYYQAGAGVDTSDGLSVEKPVLTVAQALTLIAAQTPSSTNQFTLEIIGSQVISESFAIPSYVHIHAPGAIFTGNITCANDASLVCLSIAPSSGIGVLKNSGSGFFNLTILGETNCINGDGVQSTSGRMIVKGQDVEIGAHTFILPGDIDVDVQTINGTSTSAIIIGGIAGSTTYVNLKYNRIIGGAGRLVDYPSGSHVYTSIQGGSWKLDSTAIAFDVQTNATMRVNMGHGDQVTQKYNLGGSGAILEGTILDWSESGASTNTGSTVLIKTANEPTVIARLSSSVTGKTGDGTAYTVIFEDEKIDTKSTYNLSNGINTFDRNGLYEVRTNIRFTGVNVGGTNTRIIIRLVGTASTINLIDADNSVASDSGNLTLNGSALQEYSNTDTLKVEILVQGAATKNVGIAGGSFFSINLVTEI